MKKVILFCLFCFMFHSILPAEDVVGFWKTVNDKTGKPESIIGIYEYQGKYYGRIIATYNDEGKVEETIDNPKDRAPGVVGNPFYCGLDILWNLKKNGNKYTDGKIIDPEQGKTYDAEMWVHDGNLIVRGEIWIFGENETWPPAHDNDFPPGFKKPDLTKLVPVIPQVIKHHPHHQSHHHEENVNN